MGPYNELPNKAGSCLCIAPEVCLLLDCSEAVHIYLPFLQSHLRRITMNYLTQHVTNIILLYTQCNRCIFASQNKQVLRYSLNINDIIIQAHQSLLVNVVPLKAEKRHFALPRKARTHCGLSNSQFSRLLQRTEQNYRLDLRYEKG